METVTVDVRSSIPLVRTGCCIALLAMGCVAFATGCNAPKSETDEATAPGVGDGETRRVTGIGGVFFKSADPGRAMEWYRTHLGIEAGDWGGFAFEWTEKNEPDETGYTVWGAFPDTTRYFLPSQEPFMVNFRVADLTSLIAALKEEGVDVVGEIEEHPNGKFAWILDLEGRKVELWEPVPSRDDPYLE